MGEEASHTGALPSQEELERRKQEVTILEEAGKLPGSLPTKQLVQMVAEVGMSGERSKVRGKAPCKEFLEKCLMKRRHMY